MNFLKKHWVKIVIPLILCVICAAAIIIPYVNEAADFGTYTWTVYKYNGDHCADGHTDHIVLSQNGPATSVAFYGHANSPLFEYAITNPGTREEVENEFFNFTYSDGVTDTHTLKDGGFLFNVTNNGATIVDGYMIAYDCAGNALLYYITGGTGATSTQPTRTLIAAAVSGSGTHQVAVQASSDHIVYIDNNKILFDLDLPHPTSGTSFGPYVQWLAHGCDSESSRFFQNVLCGTNKYPPIADFDYNVPIADVKQSVYVIPSISDGNTPATTLTSLWTVEKKNEDGTWRTLCTDQPYPFTQYNANGIGIYRTTLKVRNEYYFYSTVTKEVEIVNGPRISIVADKSQYYPGDTVVFKDGNWYNCKSSEGDVIIENVVSNNLYNPSINLIGSSSISKASGNLTATVRIDYRDGTYSNQSVTIPPSGLTITDVENSAKQVAKITTTYNSLPGLAEADANKGVTYSFETKNPLSNYYAGGASSRRYEITNTAICKILLNTRYVSTNAEAKTNLLDSSLSFALSGTIDNKGAITTPPACNTEFLLTGISSGGENISKYIVVTNGKSPLIEAPYGEYTLSEGSGFTLGYDLIKPISVTLDKRGVTYNETNTVPDKGEIPFVKAIQVTNIDISRVYESEGGVPLKSSTDFKVNLVGIPVIKEIQASFPLTSPKNDSTYYYNSESVLTVPVGTYTVEETQSFRLASLESISMNSELLWNRVLNIKRSGTSHKGTFISPKGQASSVVLKYISDEFVYDEYIYRNELHFNTVAVSRKGADLTGADKVRVLQDPQSYRYPITLRNAETDEEYCGIIESGPGISFRYMNPGKYIIECSNNMYMNMRELREINSNDIEIGVDAGKYYIIIPDENSGGEYEERAGLTDWRGYSSVSHKIGHIYPDVGSHVSLHAKSFNQNDEPVGDCGFQFYRDDELIYFVERDGKLYPSTEETDGSESTFYTDENGFYDIYKFPVGVYEVKPIPPDGWIATEPTQIINVNNSRNMGIFIELVDIDKLSAPTSIELFSLKNVIDIGETIKLSNKVSPALSYKNVVFESLDSEIASASENGEVTGHKKGMATIIVRSELDNSVFGKFEITVQDPSNPDMRVLKQTVSDIYLEVEEEYKATTVYCPSDAVFSGITWTSTNPAIATVSADGLITGKSVGTTDVIASCDGLTAICHVTVGETEIPVESVTYKEENIQLIYNVANASKGKVEVSVHPTDATNPTVTFASSDPDIVSVDADGNLIAKTAGLATITATSSNGIEATCLVSSVSIVEEITLNVDSMSLVKGTTSQIMADTAPIGSINENDLIWKSLDPSIATVDSTGKITAIEVGETTVVATISYPGTPDVTATCAISVKTDEVPPTNLDVCSTEEFETLVFSEPIEMAIGEEYEFFARVRPASSTNCEVEWSCDPSNIITISPADPDNYNASKPVNKWKIAADNDIGGEVTVTGNVKGTDVKTQFTVIVDAPGIGFHFNAEGRQKIILNKEPYDKLTIGVLFDNIYSRARTINWSLSDETKASISYPDPDKRNVLITGIETGTVTLTCEITFRLGGTYTQTIEIDIEDPRIDVLVDNTPVTEITLMRGKTEQFVVEPNYPMEPAESDYTTTLAKPVAEVVTSGNNTENGLGYEITGLKVGTTTLTITPADPDTPPVTINVNIIRNPDIHEHEPTLVSDKAATCTSVGYVSHYECSCGSWFTDSIGDYEIANKDAYIIPALGHITSSGYNSNASYHWNLCTRCGANVNIQSHQFSYQVVDSSYHRQTCSVCGYTTANQAHRFNASNRCVDCNYQLVVNYYINGYVINATNLSPISGATIKFRAGSNNTSGSYVSGTATSNSSGKFTIYLPSGSYTAEVTKSGFATAYVNMVSSTSGSQQTATLSPLQSQGDIRAILKWGSTPRDLDTHLEGTHNGSTVNVYYGAKTFSDVITLDVDNTSGGGPETLSIKWKNVGESYTYWVKDYTNSSNSSSTAMSNSGAYVEIYQSNVLVARVDIPTGRAGTKWTVFSVNSSGNISIINSVGN